MDCESNKVDWRPFLERYVSGLKQTGAIRSAAVEAAFRRVPRHLLIDSFYRFDGGGMRHVVCDPHRPSADILDIIYSDQAIVTQVEPEPPPDPDAWRRIQEVFFERGEPAPDENGRFRPSSSTSQPSLVAQMLEALQLAPGMRVLEIGAGTGYNAALMANLVGSAGLVATVDIQDEVVAKTRRHLSLLEMPNVQLVAQDGHVGVPEYAPYDRVVATVGCPDLSPHWLEQLTPDGCMLIPLQFGCWYPLVKVWRAGPSIKGRFVARAGFMSIQGALACGGIWPFEHAVSFPFAGFKEVAKLAVTPAQLYDFSHFLTMRDRRFMCNNKPCIHALYDRERGVVGIDMQTGSVLLKGDQALYAELRELFNEWSEAGKPKWWAYTMEFVPLQVEGAASAEMSRHSIWTIERHYFRQFCGFLAQ